MERPEQNDDHEIKQGKTHMNEFSVLRDLLVSEFIILVEMQEIVAKCRRQGGQSAIGAGITGCDQTQDKDHTCESTQREGNRWENLIVDHHTRLVDRKLESRCLCVIN